MKQAKDGSPIPENWADFLELMSSEMRLHEQIEEMKSACARLREPWAEALVWREI